MGRPRGCLGHSLARSSGLQGAQDVSIVPCGRVLVAKKRTVCGHEGRGESFLSLRVEAEGEEAPSFWASQTFLKAPYNDPPVVEDLLPTFMRINSLHLTHLANTDYGLQIRWLFT